MSEQINGRRPGGIKPISTKYKSRERVGEFGWLWVSEELSGMKSRWVLVHTFRAGDGQVLIRAADDLSGKASPPTIFEGAAYLPIRPPECPRDAGFLAQIFLPDGHVTSVSIYEAGPSADLIRDRFLHLAGASTPTPATRLPI